MTISFRAVAVGSALLLFAMEGVALAVSMSGAVRTFNPSAGTVRHKLVVGDTVATTPGTGMGRGIDIGANVFTFDVQQMRVFPAFPGVAQNTEIATTEQASAMFRGGAGANGFPAGQGGVAQYTTTIDGTTTTVTRIDWCPARDACRAFANATVAGGQGRIVVSPGPNVFGGTFRLLRHIKQGSGAWFVFNPGATVVSMGFNPNLRGVETVMTGGGGTITQNTDSSFWSAGIDNLETVLDVNPENLLYSGRLGPDGAIQTLLNFNGTSPNDPPDGEATGFKMTTGTINVSDATPSTPGGGPFQASTKGFDDRDASGNGNIQLVGGAVAWGGLSGNVFFRVTRLTMAVPEPASALALGAGFVALGGLAWARRKRSEG